MATKIILTKKEIEDAYGKRNLDEASEILGVSVVTLRKRMAELGIQSHSNGWRPNTHIDKELLENMYQEYSVPEIAKMLVVNMKTVYARTREYGIELRRQGPVRSFSPSPDELKSLYKDKGMSMKAIAKHYGVGETVVFKRLSECGLAKTLDERKASKERVLADKKARLSYSNKAWRKAVLESDGYKCKKCGVEAGLCEHCQQRIFLQTHHIKAVKKYPELRYVVSNGITLCRSCHANEHR